MEQAKIYKDSNGFYYKETSQKMQFEGQQLICLNNLTRGGFEWFDEQEVAAMETVEQPFCGIGQTANTNF